MSPGAAASTAPWIVEQLGFPVVHVFELSPGTFHVRGVVVHAPPTHTEPGPQLFPHAPQLPRSVSTSTQVPPHTCWPAAH